MNETIKIADGAVQQLFHAPVWVLVAIGGLAFGFIVKSTVKILKQCWPKIGFLSQLIPLFVIGFTGLLYSRLGNPSDVIYTVPHPRAVLAFYGCLVGFIVWPLHALALRRLEKFAPWLKPVIAQSGYDSSPPIPLADGSNVNPRLQKDLSTPEEPPKVGL